MTISLSSDKVRIDLRMTAGVAIVPNLLKQIDLNGDGQISSSEKLHYQAILTRDLSIRLDGRNTALRLLSASFPKITDIKKGIGDLLISYNADLDTTVHTHHFTLDNGHYPTYSVYLVNCLLPADTTIQITRQERNTEQSNYQLDFTTGIATEQVMAVQTGRWPVVKTFFIQGVRHILSGYDHLLFLGALVLGIKGLWDLIKIVTLFTIAHSITLTLAVFGLVGLPGQIIEPAIAASIIFVSIQNIAWPEKAGSRYRLAVAFFFGLFHGLGFAGGLLEIMHTMPGAMIICAVVGFSLGVEAGNQLIILPLFGTVQLLKITAEPNMIRKIQMIASAFVAMGGIYYLITGF